MSSIYNVAIYPAVSVKAVIVVGGGVISATPSKLLVCRGNTNLIVAQGVYDQEAQQFWTNNASVSGILLDEFGNEILTCPMGYVVSSQGAFQGTFGDINFYPPLERGYTLVLKGQNGIKGFTFPMLAEVIRTVRFTGPPQFSFPVPGPMPTPPTPPPLTGDSVFPFVSADGDNARLIVAGARVVTGYAAFNASPVNDPNKVGYQLFIKLYDVNHQPDPTSDQVKMTIGIQSGLPAASSPDVQVLFNNGIGMAIVKGALANDDTPVLAGDCVGEIFYQ